MQYFQTKYKACLLRSKQMRKTIFTMCLSPSSVKKQTFVTYEKLFGIIAFLLMQRNLFAVNST